MTEQEKSETGCTGSDRKRSVLKKLRILLVLVVGVSVFALVCLAYRYRTPGLEDLLKKGKLARLPESTENIEFKRRPDFDDGRREPDQYIVLAGFQTKPDDIDEFIANSNSIDESNFILRQVTDANDVPKWWPLNEDGRIYQFNEKEISGAVAVYYDSNTVCIYAWYRANTFSHDIKIVKENLREGYEEFIDFVADVIHEVKDVFED